MVSSILGARVLQHRFFQVRMLPQLRQRSVKAKSKYKHWNQETRPPEKAQHVPGIPHSIAPDQIPVRHVVHALRLKWANALPRRIKWGKRIAWFGAAIAFLVGEVWVQFQEVVPSSCRKRLNFFASGRLREFMVAHERNYFPEISLMDGILELAKKQPGLVWADAHPVTVVVRTVFARLIASSGVDPEGAKIYLVNAPSE